MRLHFLLITLISTYGNYIIMIPLIPEKMHKVREEKGGPTYLGFLVLHKLYAPAENIRG